MDYTAVGQVTHLAARMEQMAQPGTILLTPETLALAEGFVQVISRGPVPVKGLATPIEIFELVGASPVRSRLHAAASRGLTRFVGRDAEIELLRHALGRAGEGHGQLVAIVGEPGVGKSRLVWEFIHSHRSQGWLVLEAASVSYGQATTYLPVIELLRRYFGIEPHDDGRKIVEKVTGKLLSLDRALEATLPPFLSLLDVPVESPEWARLDPPRRRQQTMDALKRLLVRESQMQPVLLVVEDLHWIDSETQAWLDLLVESLPTARLLLLVNYRPEYRHGWASKTLLPAGAARRPAGAERARAAGRAARDGPGSRASSAPPDRAHAGQSLLPGGERAGAGRDASAHGRTRGVSTPGPDPEPPASGHGASDSGGAHRPPCAGRQATAAGRSGGREGRAVRVAAGDRRGAGGECSAIARAAASGGVPLRSAALPGPRIHVQARADARGDIRGSPPGTSTHAPRPHSGGDGAALWRPPG